ncbi:MAG: response regulator, partial [Spirochaetaceae bacterium]|nr:response regulator [Spirochaetaceae bacterium]
MIQIMVVTGHEEDRARLAGILYQWPEFAISGLGRDAYDALTFARLFRPDIALVDEDLPILDCSEIVSALKRRSPDTRVIVLANSCDSRAVLKAIANGAAGYLLKDRDTEIIPGINSVYTGRALIGSEVIPRAFGDFPLGQMRPRQRVKITRKELEL